MDHPTRGRKHAFTLVWNGVRLAFTELQLTFSLLVYFLSLLKVESCIDFAQINKFQLDQYLSNLFLIQKGDHSWSGVISLNIQFLPRLDTLTQFNIYVVPVRDILPSPVLKSKLPESEKNIYLD